MANISTEDILKKVDEIIDLLKQDSDYIRYQKLKEDVSKNGEITALIEDIKNLQKQLVLLEHEKKNTNDVSTTLDKKLKSLESYPLYSEFVITQEEVTTSKIYY